MYLNPELKAYYLEDFDRLLNLDDAYWTIDSELLQVVLSKINQNKNIQSLYSKHDDKDESYLFFTFSNSVELKLFRFIIPQMLSVIPGLTYEYLPPRINLNTGLNNGVILACVTDENYFNVHQIRLGLVSADPILHKDFWNLVQNLLCQV